MSEARDHKEDSMIEARVNEGYELYQIISDFGNPLEIFREAIQNSFDENATQIYVNVFEKTHIDETELIIDVLDNGDGLLKEKVDHFFDTANSTKVDEKYLSIGKHGYKGHGSKVFFNAERVVICSKTKGGDCWTSELDKPLKQIRDNGKLLYSKPSKPKDKEIMIPETWESGFRVRIYSPRLFKSQQTRSHLSHIYLRDYCKWYSIFGTVETIYNDELKNKNVFLFLSGLNISNFKNEYATTKVCDPIPKFENAFEETYEKIPLGHSFPEERVDEKTLREYVKSIESKKYWFDYYSKIIYNKEVVQSGVSFRVIISLEGYEAKRRYDLLLSKKGATDSELRHTDASRYGLWACKGGVPVEKVDDWIEGGRGVGTYTYMQAFIDCDEFQLTANRGSIRNTDIEKLDLIKAGFNRIWKSAEVTNAIREREYLEDYEKRIISIEDDEKALGDRYKKAKARKTIVFPDGDTFLEPTKTGKSYNESETFALLVAITQKYPKLFGFRLMDYNTSKGIDFVVDHKGTPKYVELKGTLTKKMNHPFRHIYKFITYDIDVKANEEVEDFEFCAVLKVNKGDKFESPDENFNHKKYTSYVLEPLGTAAIQSMEIIKLKSFLSDVIGAKIE